MSYVYFVKDCNSGLIKIGKAQRLYDRVRSLPAQTRKQGWEIEPVLLAYVEGGYYEERAAHRALAPYADLMLNEWFRIPDDNIQPGIDAAQQYKHCAENGDEL